jgi:hypothetical protein
MNKATLSGDIISYTALPVADRRKLEKEIRFLLDKLSHKYKTSGFYGRLVQGDHIECALHAPRYILRIALIIKTYVKSLEIPQSSDLNNRLKLFKEYGLRLAVAVAPLETLDAGSGIIDGEAIQLSGRLIQNQDTSEKQRLVIKRALFFKASDSEVEAEFDPVFALLDTLLSKSSGKQCQVVYHKLMGLHEDEIAKKLSKHRSTINQHGLAAGWHAIEQTVSHFEKRIR